MKSENKPRHRGKCHAECTCTGCACSCACICTVNHCTCCIPHLSSAKSEKNALLSKEFKYVVKRVGNSGHIIVDKDLVGKQVKVRIDVID